MKTKKNLVLLGVMITLLVGCNASKNVISPQEKAEIVEILESRQYRVDFNAAFPQNTVATQQVVNQIMLPTGNSSARIDIAGDGDFMTIKNKMGMADLPFFGERRIGSSYNNTDVGINFDNEVTDYQIMDDKKSIRVSFRVRGVDDAYKVTLNVFGNKNVTAFITCSDKTNMKYDGTLSRITQDKAL
jgi:hypothetical protein